uniref:Uncharacterized protein n=1 Tax=Triticum urartu TaxID=4572 RepID=A0A8R7PJ43_TRIUA
MAVTDSLALVISSFTSTPGSSLYVESTFTTLPPLAAGSTLMCDVAVSMAEPMPPPSMRVDLHSHFSSSRNSSLSFMTLKGMAAEVKLNCLTLPMLPSPLTGWALATMWGASLGARVCQSMTPARNRRGAATEDSISWVQLLVEAIAAAIN